MALNVASAIVCVTRPTWNMERRQRQPAARTDVSEEVKYYSKENQRARRRPFLKFFMLNQFKLHPMLGVRQRSRLVTEEGGENASCGH